MEIILGTSRQRWSESQKRELVAESLVEGVTVTSVALRHGVSRSMLFAWRKRLLGEAGAPPAPARFVPVAVTPPLQPPASEASDAPTIDVAFPCGARLRVAGAADPDLVAGIVKALKRG